MLSRAADQVWLPTWSQEYAAKLFTLGHWKEPREVLALIHDPRTPAMRRQQPTPVAKS